MSPHSSGTAPASGTAKALLLDLAGLTALTRPASTRPASTRAGTGRSGPALGPAGRDARCTATFGVHLAPCWAQQPPLSGQAGGVDRDEQRRP